jgi:SsrA-binding protein
MPRCMRPLFYLGRPAENGFVGIRFLQEDVVAAMIMFMAAKSRKRKDKDKQGPVAVNKKAYRNFELVEKTEAGLELLGTEVKSLRAAAADLSGSYARIEDGQCWLVGASIAQYEQAGARQHEPTRKRRLLLHRIEIHRLRTKLEQRGFTLVPLRVYFNDRGLAKIELALARGKRQYDKRKTITERDQKRDVDRSMKKYRR